MRECVTWEEFASALRDEDDGERPIDVTGAVLAEVRKRLDGYAAAIPHHTATGFGTRATITSATEWCVYAVSVRAVFETRRLGHGEAPYSGWRVPATPADSGRLDVWDFRYRPNPNLTGRSEYVVTGTQVTSDCGQCGGRGESPCGTCSGGRAVACPVCVGRGTVEGVVRTEQRQKACDNYWDTVLGRITCQGGYLDNQVCVRCQGRAFIWYDYPVCGQVPCSHCKGHLQVPCTTCTGTGRINCGQCHGCKKVVRFATVCRTFEPWSRAATAPGRGCDPEAVDALTRRKLYQPLVQLIVADPPPDADLGPTGVAAAVRSLLDAVRADATDHRRAGSLAVEVGRATAVRVEYQSGGRHVAWLLGRERAVHAPTSPVTDALAEKLRQAAGHWPVRKKEAVALVREAVAMGEKDGFCRAVLEARRSALPPGLWDAATNPGVLGAMTEGVGKLFGKWFG